MGQFAYQQVVPVSGNGGVNEGQPTTPFADIGNPSTLTTTLAEALYLKAGQVLIVNSVSVSLVLVAIANTSESRPPVALEISANVFLSTPDGVDLAEGEISFTGYGANPLSVPPSSAIVAGKGNLNVYNPFSLWTNSPVLTVIANVDMAGTSPGDNYQAAIIGTTTKSLLQQMTLNPGAYSGVFNETTVGLSGTVTTDVN